MKGLEELPSWKVKLEIIPNFKVVVNPDTGEPVIDPETGDEKFVDIPTRYEFTITDAIEYMVGKGYYFWIDDMLMHNVNMRDAIREYGSRAVTNEIRKIIPGDKQLERELDEFAKSHRKGSVGNLNIQVRSIDEEVEFYGHKLNGLKDIVWHLDASLRSEHGCVEKGNNQETVPLSDGKIHVGNIWMPYPCFDVFDIWNESRYYENYIIRNRPITSSDLNKLNSMGRGFNDVRITEDMSLDMLPMVYYSGEGHYMLVATTKECKKML